MKKNQSGLFISPCTPPISNHQLPPPKEYMWGSVPTNTTELKDGIPTEDDKLLIPVTREEEEEEEEEEQTPPKSKLSADWWAVVVGVANFIVVVCWCVVYPYDDGEDAAEWLLPRPRHWTGNIFDAFPRYTVIGLVIVFLCMGASVVAMAGDRVMIGYTVVWFISLVCLTVNAQPDLKNNGLSYAVTCIATGLLITNFLGKFVELPKLKKVAGLGEWFIKVSLVTLAVDMGSVARYGAPGILVGWLKSPVSIVMTYLMGVHLFKCNKHLSMLIAVGVSWCGASAITAVAPVIQAPQTDVVAAIGIVCALVLVWNFSLPFFCKGLGFSDNMAGAFLGASVDQTANVVVAGNIVSNDASEVAATVKMILNAGLGLMCVGVSVFWTLAAPDELPNPQKITLKFLYEKFPKFVLGFLILSTALFVLTSFILSDVRKAALPSSLQAVSNWWAALGFTCIGLNTDIVALYKSIPRCPAFLTYFVGGTLDVSLSLLAAYVFFDLVDTTLPGSEGDLPNP
eukprot:TRINITY_DN11647_c0_g1_i3.p1 TRINITY_DN11647_c0_g1~~TRINITY_DN11647_c0_g1_i3.p1  ORF type:complete len:512 (+),score=75.75 TRINITY_DN11647_c0_g1_i3:932-2467(+)